MPSGQGQNQQQTQTTYDNRSRMQTPSILVGDKHSHHCAICAPQTDVSWQKGHI